MNAFFSKYKHILFVVIIVVVLVTATWAVVKFTGLGAKIDEKLAERKLGSALDAEITPTAVTLTPADAERYASQLHTAMKGWGTDEDAIYAVFMAMKTRSDVLYLIKTFGCRGGKTLIEWLTSELNTEERTKLNSIIANNNIDYSF